MMPGDMNMEEIRRFTHLESYKKGVNDERERILKIINNFRNTADYGKGWEEIKKFRAYLKSEIMEKE